MHKTSQSFFEGGGVCVWEGAIIICIMGLLSDKVWNLEKKCTKNGGGVCEICLRI